VNYSRRKYTVGRKEGRTTSGENTEIWQRLEINTEEREEQEKHTKVIKVRKKRLGITIRKK
jgi:hypothetical protein